MEALLSNEFVVLALDALLHIASVIALGIVVIIASKFLTKGFVDAKLITGLTIAVILVLMRVFLLNNAHHLAGLDVIITMALVGFILFLTSLVLVYKIFSLPVLGAILSSIVIVAAQLALAHYTPVLSLKLMPEGQRFAEYAGVSNERTKQLMARAQNFQGESKSNIGKVLQEALATLAFWSSEEEQATLSKDLASGVAFIQERRAYMASMTEEELDEYRAAMASFMQEQGVDLTNRYSLDNLKNATPEDLENLANFMKDMNKEYGFTDDLPEGEGDDAPATLESLKQIAKNLQGVKIKGEGGEKFAALLKEMMDGEDFQNEMDKVRGQIADLKANSGQLMKTFKDADLEGMKSQLEGATSGRNSGTNPDVPSYPLGSDVGRGQKLFSQVGPSGLGGTGHPARPFESSSNRSMNKALLDLVLFEETGYYPTYTELEMDNSDEPTGQVGPSVVSQVTSQFGQTDNTEINTGSNFSENSFPEATTQATSRVDYYIPVNADSSFPEPSPNAEKPSPVSVPEPEPVQVVETPLEDMSDYFPASALSNSLTDDYVLRAPKSAEDRNNWVKVANTIKVGAWFEGTGGTNKGTIFIDGIAYRSGEKIERVHDGERYLFRFEGVIDGQVLITSLKREVLAAAN